MERKLKNILVRAFLNHPIRFRLGLVFIAILAGVTHPWLKQELTQALSPQKTLFMLVFSTLTFMFILTLYRILQNLFRRGVEIEGGKIEYDERSMVSTAGIFWFIPFGLTLQVGTFTSSSSDPHFGEVMIIQGISIALGAWLSKLLKQ